MFGRETKPSVYFYAFFAMLFWGFSFVWTKVVLDYLNPVSVIFFRLVVSSLLLFLFITIMRRREPIRRSDIKWFLLSAFFEPFLYFTGENYGVMLSTATISAVMIALIPVLTPVVAFVVLREKIGPWNIAGIFISFLGVLVMVTGNGMRLEVEPMGLLFLGMAVIAGLFSSVLMGRLAKTYSSLTIITYQNIIGIFYFLPLFIFLDKDNLNEVTFNFELVSSLIMLAVFASSFAFIFYVNAIRKIGVSRTNIFTNLIPVITAIVSFFWIGETFTTEKIAGIALVISGVFMAQVNMRRIRDLWRKPPKS